MTDDDDREMCGVLMESDEICDVSGDGDQDHECGKPDDGHLYHQCECGVDW